MSDAELDRIDREIEFCMEGGAGEAPAFLYAMGLSDWTQEREMVMTKRYREFLEAKAQLGTRDGFEPLWMPDFLFDFQEALVRWALLKGQGAILADCGLGKSPMQLVWAQNVLEKENKPVLILTPLAVSFQTMREAEKFGVECQHSRDGKFKKGIVVTNYEQLHCFNPDDFAGCVCDESSILKSFDGVRRKEITEFMRTLRYRLLCTATAAPNDYIELGTSSEALGYLGHTDMLTRFFKNDQNTIKPTHYLNKGKDFSRLREDGKWRFKGHAEEAFWKWVCSWARAVRKPSDLGFDDGKFILPPLIEKQHVVESETLAPGMLLPLPAVGLREQREESRRTITERCDKVAALVDEHDSSIVWCHLNTEGDLLEKIIPHSVQVSGSDSDEAKENKFRAFVDGKVARLITKPKIGAWGLNFQMCNHETFFPSHSFEQYYQGVRRCWRFGQKRPVTIDIVTTEGERDVIENQQRKTQAADKMFARLVEHMREHLNIERGIEFNQKEEIPAWL